MLPSSSGSGCSAIPRRAPGSMASPISGACRVYPSYSTNAANNPAGLPFADPAPLSSLRGPTRTASSRARSGSGDRAAAIVWHRLAPVCPQLRGGGHDNRAAYDRARVVLNTFAIDTSSAWSRSEPQFLGFRTFLAVTDTSSAARYGLQTARLSRAGDNVLIGRSSGRRTRTPGRSRVDEATGCVVVQGAIGARAAPRGVSAHHADVCRGRPSRSGYGCAIGLCRLCRVRRHRRADTRRRTGNLPSATSRSLRPSRLRLHGRRRDRVVAAGARTSACTCARSRATQRPNRCRPRQQPSNRSTNLGRHLRPCGVHLPRARRRQPFGRRTTPDTPRRKPPPWRKPWSTRSWWTCRALPRFRRPVMAPCLDSLRRPFVVAWRSSRRWRPWNSRSGRDVTARSRGPHRVRDETGFGMSAPAHGHDRCRRDAAR